MKRSLLEIISSILVLSGQNPPGPAGGAPDGYGLGRGAAGPRAELHWPQGTGQCRTGRTRLLRVASQDVTIHMPRYG